MPVPPGRSSCRQRRYAPWGACPTRSLPPSQNSSPRPCLPIRTGCPNRCVSSSRAGGWRAEGTIASPSACSRTTTFSTLAASSTVLTRTGLRNAPPVALAISPNRQRIVIRRNEVDRESFSLDPPMDCVGGVGFLLILIFRCSRGVSAGMSSFSCALRSSLSAVGQAVAARGGLCPWSCATAQANVVPGPVGWQVRDWLALRAGQSGGNVEDLAALRRSACHGVLLNRRGRR